MMVHASWLKLGGCLVLLGACLGCDGGSKASMDDTAGTSAGGAGGTAATTAGSIAEKYIDYFPVGVALGSIHLSTMGDIVDRDFNHLTCENAMKIKNIHPAEATFAWQEADYIADYARNRGIKLTGHALLWHREVPDWMFAGVTASDATSLETLKSRLKAHIEAMVERYGDVVDNWDVVNEAISDDAAKTYRDGGEGSKWFELFGSEEYIYWAFKYAKDALEAQSPGSSAGKLYYNEYLVTNKADRILQMLAWLKDDKGIQIDGVGFQSHETMTWPSVADLQKAIDKFVAAGYKTKISELDVTVYSDYSTGSFVASPAVELTADLETKQAKRFADLFALYRQNKANVTSVTLWGVSDDQTWLDNEPVPGRNDHPLIFNEQHQPKAARAAIMNF
jgi:endo-1,4-beta-xylanase